MNHSGFTLTEVLIGAAVAALVSALLLLIMVNNTGLFYQQSAKVEQGLASNDSLSTVKSSIRGASLIASQYPETGTASYTSGAEVVVLKIRSIDSSGNILPAFDFFIYLKNQDNFKFLSFPDASSQRLSSEQILSRNVDALLFQYFDLSGSEVTPSSSVKVKITLKLRQKAGSLYESNLSTAEAHLRND